MKFYRICCMTQEGRIGISYEMRCLDDLMALAEAERLSSDHTVEAWDGARLVARVKIASAPLLLEDRKSL